MKIFILVFSILLCTGCNANRYDCPTEEKVKVVQLANECIKTSGEQAVKLAAEQKELIEPISQKQNIESIKITHVDTVDAIQEKCFEKVQDVFCKKVIF
jgi:hypothetical protein